MTTTRKRTPTEIHNKIQEISKLESRAYPERLIPQEVMEYYGVKCGLSPVNRDVDRHYYPSHDQDGKITGYKCRKLPKDFESEGVWGKLVSLFGENKAGGGKFVIVVEGEADTLAARTMLLKNDKRYNVVGLPTGTSEDGTIHPVVMRRVEWLSQFETVLLCLDMDKPGQETVKQLAELLCSQTTVRIASLPMKDSAAMLEAGKSTEWYRCINNARKYITDQIIEGGETPLAELIEPLERGLYFDWMPRTCDMLYGFRPGEMTTVIAEPKAGKTSWLRFMQYDILRSTDEKVGGFFLEERIKKTKQAILACHAGVPLNKFRADPSCADRRLVEEAHELYLPRLHLFTHKNKTITDDILERKIDYMVHVLGCRTVILDHTTFVVGTRATNNERRDIDMMLTRLARSVEDNDYRLFIVAHINRKGREQSRQDERQKYPYWEILSMTDARSSGAYEQLSHNMIGIEKEHLDPEGDSTRGRVRTRVLLSREWGSEGVGDYLSWNNQGRFQPIHVEV